MGFTEQINSLSVKDYKTAFAVLREDMKEIHLRILEAHYKAPGHDITASQLANLMEFVSFNVSNLRYGKLAGKVCNFFQITASTHLYVLVEFEHVDGEWHWIMRPQVVQALRELKWFDEPQNYVQYHNSEKTGISCLTLDYKGGFRVSTSKSVSNLIGNRMWLIGGIGKNPRQYYLCSHFIVNKVGTAKNQPFFKYFIAGQIGRAFEPPILLNDLGWFSDFLQRQQNFHLGLRRLNSKDIAKLEKLIDHDENPLNDQKQVVKTGGGFGDAETNRKVEKAAINRVTNHYRENGWSVQSVEQKKLGYDLLCKKGTQEEHVEVKGTQGEIEAFIITLGEVKQSEIDDRFVLYIVTSALSAKPPLLRYTSREFERKFSLQPIQYRATKT